MHPHPLQFTGDVTGGSTIGIPVGVDVIGHLHGAANIAAWLEVLFEPMPVVDRHVFYLLINLAHQLVW
jgi:hypothetical protein